MLTAAGETIAVDEKIHELISYTLPTNLVARVSTKKAYPSPGRGSGLS